MGPGLIPLFYFLLRLGPPHGGGKKDIIIKSQNTCFSHQGEALEGPFDGITVIDLTRVLAGPYCTMILADLGARVIKVEPPQGDDSRRFGPFVEGKSAYFMSLNRGKQSIALDLKARGDREIFQRLLARADVLVENFRPGAMERLGLDWHSLHPRYPRLVYAAVSGFGQSGPLAGQPAYDLVIQAMGGVMSITGTPGGPPVRVGTSIGDLAAGLYAAIGIGAALYHREQSGRGMQVDVAMLDCQVSLLENAIARFMASGVPPGPLGSRHPSITPFDAYATAGGHIVIAAGNDELFARLCRALGREELLEDPRFADNPLRTRHQAELKRELEAVLAGAGSEHWLQVLGRAGVPCGPINDIGQVVNHPQVAARNMLVTARDPAAGTVTMAGNPVKTSAFTDPAERPPAPELDQHRREILQELGMDPR